MGVITGAVSGAAGGVWLLASRTIGFALFGLLLGGAALGLLWSVLAAAWSGGGFSGRVPLALAIAAVPLSTLAWAISGYQHGLRAVVYRLARAGKAPLLELLMQRFQAHARPRGWLAADDSMKDSSRAIDHFLERSGQLPVPQRWVAALLHSQLPLAELSTRLRLPADDPYRAGRSDLALLHAELGAHVDREWLTPGLDWALLLLLGQLGFYALLWWWA